MERALAPTMGAVEWALLLALSVLWGGSFFFAKVALAEISPLGLVLLRVGIAAVALGTIARLAGHRLAPSPGALAAFAVMGLLNNVVPFTLIFWGQTRIASSVAAILNAATPLFTVVLAHRLTRDERLTRGRLAGVLLGLVGVAVMLGPEALAGLGGNLAAQLACLAGACSYALAGIYGRRFRGQPAMVTATGQLAASTLLLLPLVLLLHPPASLAPPGLAVIAAVLGLALLSTVLAYVLYFRILAVAGASNLLLVTFLIPACAILLGVLVLGERLEAQHLAGMALIGLGLAAIDGRLARV